MENDTRWLLVLSLCAFIAGSVSVQSCTLARIEKAVVHGEAH